jgi:hypothetical protein
MLLGDLISRFEDETVAAETLVGLCDLALTASVSAAAARHDITSGEFVARCVGRFVQEAPNEDWTTLIGLMGRSYRRILVTSEVRRQRLELAI